MGRLDEDVELVPGNDRLKFTETSLAILESDWRDLREFRALFNALALVSVIPLVG